MRRGLLIVAAALLIAAASAAAQQQPPGEQVEQLTLRVLRGLDTSPDWNPRDQAWNVYRANVRYTLEQDLRRRVQRGESLDETTVVTAAVARWKQLHERGWLGRRRIELDPAAIKIPDSYRTVTLDETLVPDFIRSCLPAVPNASVALLTGAGGSYEETTRWLADDAHMFIARGNLAACIPMTRAGYAIPAVDSFVNTVQVFGMPEDDVTNWYRAVGQEVAASGVSESLVKLPTGNGFEVTFAVHLEKPHMLLYSSRFLRAGTYDESRYRTVRTVPGMKTVVTYSFRADTGADLREKPLLATPEEIQRHRNRRESPVKPGAGQAS